MVPSLCVCTGFVKMGSLKIFGFSSLTKLKRIKCVREKNMPCALKCIVISISPVISL